MEIVGLIIFCIVILVIHNNEKNVLHSHGDRNIVKIKADPSPKRLTLSGLPRKNSLMNFSFPSSEDYGDNIEKMLKASDRQIRAQDKQIEAVNRAKDKYQKTKNLENYVAFWDKIFANGGLIFNGRKWLYEAIEAYIEFGRYDTAWKMLNEYNFAFGATPRSCGLQIQVLKKEGRYQAAIEFAMRKHGYDAESLRRFKKDKLLKEIKPLCRKVKKDIDPERITMIAENAFIGGVYNESIAHSELKSYFSELGLIKSL